MGTVIAGGVVLAAAAGAVVSVIKSRRKGKCAGCAACCRERQHELGIKN